MENNFPAVADLVAPQLDPVCCFNQCPPLWELEDNQFLALVYFALGVQVGYPAGPVDPQPAADIQEAAKNAWCSLNQLQLCSVPPDKLKAMILWQINALLTS